MRLSVGSALSINLIFFAVCLVYLPLIYCPPNPAIGSEEALHRSEHTVIL